MTDNKKSSATQVEVQSVVSTDTTPQAEALDIVFDNWSGTKATITNESSATVYNVKYHHYKKPHVVLHNTDGTELGRAAMHEWKQRVAIEFGSHAYNIDLKSSSSTRFAFPMPGNSGRELIWRSKSGLMSKGFELNCHDDNGQLVARLTTTFGYRPSKWKNLGKLEISGPTFDTQAKKDELVMVAVSLAHAMVRGDASSAAVVGAAAGGAGAAAAGGGGGGGGGC